jgi:hypothetical protein
MNLLIKFFRFVILTIIILPMWVLTCLAGFFIAIILDYLFYRKENIEVKYRNNVKKTFIDFKNDVISIFYYY